MPHHVVQRGARRLLVFLREGDFETYLGILGSEIRRRDVELWAYCLMPNHVHLIAVPSQPESLARAIGEANRRYAERVNRREGWRGHLWQERFWSFPMEERHLLAATRYVLRNPVRARLVERAESWPYSSAGALVNRHPNLLVNTKPLLDRITDWRPLLEGEAPESIDTEIRRHSSTGRPLGSAAFVADLERRLGRPLAYGRRGRPSKTRRMVPEPVQHQSP